MDIKQYMEAVSRMEKDERRQRRSEFWRLLVVILLAVLAATPWSFLMAVLAVKVVTG